MDGNIGKLKQDVYDANIALKNSGLAILTWGNASGCDREAGLVAIKPSGVAYEDMTADDIVVLDMDGRTVAGSLKPSSDTATHLYLYRHFQSIGGIVHTHSAWATVFSQMGKRIPCYGTTHADTFYGDIPCTRKLTAGEIGGNYETETGKVIAEHFRKHNLNPAGMPGVLVRNHGPFCWGNIVEKALENAVILENVAMMAYHTRQGCPSAGAISRALLDRHFLRKHGENAYYGQQS